MSSKESHQTIIPLYEEFYKENFEFFYFGPTQTAVRMIVNMINDENIPIQLFSLPLQQIALQVMEEAILNELQIALWSIFVEKFVWNEDQKSIRTSLIYAALLTKVRMGESIEFLINKYSKKEYYFRIFYEKWSADKESFIVDVKEINSKFLKLSKTKSIKVNYGYVVDDILLHYVPYNQRPLATIPEKKDMILPNITTTDVDGNEDPLAGSDFVPPFLVDANSRSFDSNRFTITLFMAFSSGPENLNNHI